MVCRGSAPVADEEGLGGKGLYASQIHYPAYLAPQGDRQALEAYLAARGGGWTWLPQRSSTVRSE